MIPWEGGDQLTVEIVLCVNLLIDAVDDACLHNQCLLSTPRNALFHIVWSGCCTAMHYMVSERAAIWQDIADKIAWELGDWVGDTLHTSVHFI